MGKLSNIRAFALDMDGTFYLGDEILPGALDFLHALDAKGVKWQFMTNNSSRDASHYLKKLTKRGGDIYEGCVYTSGQATADYIMANCPQEKVWVLGNEFLKKELREGGVQVVEDDKEATLALCGFDTTLTFDTLTIFCDLVRGGLPYYATHPDFNCPVKGGFIPDCGAIQAAVEASTGRRPDVVIGKPNAGIVEGLVRRTGCTRDQIAMVGDRLYTDIATGVNNGMQAILVLSGESTMEDVAVSKVKPDLIYADLHAMIEDL